MNTVSDKFHELASGAIRPLDWEVGISWTKTRNEDINWFTLDVSQLDGPDLLASSENGIQPWDSYDYVKMRDRVIDLNIERSVEFPYNVQSAICDVSLDNHDGYFTYGNSKSPLHEHILPSRPIRVYLGFRGGGVTPVFVGLTEDIPEYSGRHQVTMQMTALDFLSEICKTSLRNMVMMRNARTDEVIAKILELCGLQPYMYKLEVGKNIIPFVFFDTDKNVGNALKELIQAENGAMWLDETGMIRFSSKVRLVNQDSVIVIGPDSIVSITPSQTDNIINRVHIEVDIRQVKEFQQIFSVDNSRGFESAASEDQYRLKPNGTTAIWINFEDPIWQCTKEPVLNGFNNDSSFTAVNLEGNPVSSGIIAQGTLFATSLKLEFKNTNNFPVSVNFLQIWGEPAKVSGGSPTIKYTAEDEASIEAFGIQELSIQDNNCFGSYENVDRYTTYILEHYSGFSPVLELDVKGNPALQLDDIITLEGTDYDGTWLVQSISHRLSDAKLETKLKVIKHTVIYPFILNQSALNGPDVLV